MCIGTCSICNKPIEGGDSFVMVGHYPSFWYNSLFGMSMMGGGIQGFGRAFHYNCYNKAIKEGNESAVQPLELLDKKSKTSSFLFGWLLLFLLLVALMAYAAYSFYAPLIR